MQEVKIKKESSPSNQMTGCSDGDYYPYGTSLNLEDDMVDELGIGGLAVGDIVEIRGYAFVDSKSEHCSKDQSSKNVRLQMTSLKAARETDDVVVQMYGDK